MTFVALIHISYDGDLQHFCNDVNNFLKSVSDDLQPLDKGIIPDVSYRPHEFVIFPYQVESKLSKIDVHKSCGPDQLPNWFLREFSVWLAEPVTAILMLLSAKGMFPLSGNWLMWYPCLSKTLPEISRLISDPSL